ncbi:MAG: hypothetical protein ACKVQQ_11770 [Burkholderiales bacterium]
MVMIRDAVDMLQAERRDIVELYDAYLAALPGRTHALEQGSRACVLIEAMEVHAHLMEEILEPLLSNATGAASVSSQDFRKRIALRYAIAQVARRVAADSGYAGLAGDLAGLMVEQAKIEEHWAATRARLAGVDLLALGERMQARRAELLEFIRRVVAEAPVTPRKELATQEADFTAEGAPPPGKIGTSAARSSGGPDPGLPVA